ncbi:MAG: cation:proton antiporter [Firmicutes bacterium]|nr:cation:proton antiporter [Bacillota bacterium]
MDSPALQLAMNRLLTVLVILAAGTVCTQAASRWRIPDVALYLLAGVVLGPSVLGLIDVPVASTFNQTVLLFGASFILLHGGMATSLQSLRQVWLTVTLLSTLGILITASVVALAVHLIFGIPLMLCFLLGSLLASTDPAAIVPILHQLPLSRRLSGAIISESAFTDATGAVLTVLVLTFVAGERPVSHLGLVYMFLRLTVGGALVGAAVGAVAAYLLSSKSRVQLRAYPSLLILMAALAGYTLAQSVSASGFMSVFVAGLVIGNTRHFSLSMLKQEDRQEERERSMEGLSLLLRMLIFTLLGSQADIKEILTYFLPAQLVVLCFVLVARPLTVVACLLPDRKAHWQVREIVFFSWVRETGVIAVTLVSVLISAHVPDGHVFLSVTVLAIFTTLVFQASTTPLMARVLRLHEALASREAV